MIAVHSIGVYFTRNQAFIVCLEKSVFKVQLKNYAQVDLPENSSMGERLEIIEEFMAGFIQSNGLGESSIFFALPPACSIVRQMEFPSSVKDDLASTIRYSLENYIPLKVTDLYFDFAPLVEDKEKKVIKILLGAAKKTDVKPFLDLAVRMEQGLSGVQIQSVSLANFILNQPELKTQQATDTYVFYSDNEIIELFYFKHGRLEYSRQANSSDSEHDFKHLIGGELNTLKGKEKLGEFDAEVVFSEVVLQKMTSVFYPKNTVSA